MVTSYVLPFVQLETKNDTTSESISNSPLSNSGIFSIKQGTLIANGWKISSDLIVELKQEDSNFIAINHEVEEYGIGKTESEAIQDLMTSLVDYRISLGKRETKLAPVERTDLSNLKRLLGK
jgi:hypothetical protein